jgi:lipopolysaccharide export system protein LptA
MIRKAAALIALLSLFAVPVCAQQLDMSQGGPVTVTAQDGIDWNQNAHQVIAHGNASAVRGNVTVDADRLIAYYRKKAPEPAAAPPAGSAKPPAPAAAAGAPASGSTAPSSTAPGATAAGSDPTATDTGSNEIYRLEAVGNVHIYTQTDQAQGDHAVYDMDQAVLVLTGDNLRLTTPNEVLTARDDLEYWPQKHMAVARGDAVVVTKDARRMAADTLVAYTTPDQDKPATPPAGGATPVAAKSADPATPATDDPLGASGKLQKVEAYGHVTIRTVTDTVTGDRAVDVPDTGIARVFGNVHITRGENQMNGSEAEVNQKTGISRLLSSPDERVHGLVLPNSNNGPGVPDAADPTKSGAPQSQSAAKPAKP